MTSTEFCAALEEDRALLVVQGELDERASVELREAIAKATAELTEDLTIDLAGVSFMPSASIGVLATSQAKARRNGATIALYAPEGTIAQRLLVICGLSHLTTPPG